MNRWEPFTLEELHALHEVLWSSGVRQKHQALRNVLEGELAREIHRRGKIVNARGELEANPETTRLPR